MLRLLHYVHNNVYLLKYPCNYILWNKMERMTNTLLPVRMFLTCSKVPYGNELKRGQRQRVSAALRQAQGDINFSLNGYFSNN